MALNPKLILKVGLVLFGAGLIVLGASALLAQSQTQCVSIFIIPLGCVGPGPLAWLGGAATAILGIAVIVLGLRA